MGSYLLVETRDPFESADTEQLYELAAGLVDDHHDVVVFLAQNGVLGTRRAASKPAQLRQIAGKATVLADDFSLRERGIANDELADGVRVADVEQLVDLAVSGRKIIWH
jgi:sulfur relay protein TusB/DsrH